MLAYLATKVQFLDDAPTIEDLVADAVRRNLGINVGQNEYQSWRNSLGNAMSHVMRDPAIPDDSVVAVEYRLNGRRFRIDFLVAGLDEFGNESLVIVELKQWTDVKHSALKDHVRTVVGGAERDVPHPSYQAHSYASHLRQFNEYVYGNDVNVASCAYLHNCTKSDVINDQQFHEQLSRTPVFVKGEIDGVREMIRDRISTGSDIGLLERIDSAPVRPSKQLADAAGSMLLGQEEFVLIDDQKTVLEMIVARATKAQVKQKQVLIIKGGPGTGKSVIAINALARLTSLRMNARYVTPNQAPREVFKEKLKETRGIDVGDLVSGSGSYTQPVPDQYDVLIVDEAHRLGVRSNQSSAALNSKFSEINKSLFGEDRNEITQLDWIKAQSRHQLFLMDTNQSVKPADVPKRTLEGLLDEARDDQTLFPLTSQMRVAGGRDYIEFVSRLMSGQQERAEEFGTYDLRYFDNLASMRSAIRKKDEEVGLSRLVAGYAWPWMSKGDASKHDFELDGEKLTWNRTPTDWINSKSSVEEVGSIHTVQGYDLNYAGVIIGADLGYDPANKRMVFHRHNYHDKKGKENNKRLGIAYSDGDLLEYVTNIYRVLLTRGIRGTFVYACDLELRKYLKNLIGPA